MLRVLSLPRALTAACYIVALAGCGANDSSNTSEDPLGTCSQASAHILERESLLLPPEFSEASLATGDLNGDGTPEVVLVSASGTIDVIVLQDPAVRIERPSRVPGAAPDELISGVALLDIDGDGHDEIVVSSARTNEVVVLDGPSRTQRQRLSMRSYPASMVVSDVDGDGRADLVVANLNDRTIAVLLSNGSALVPRQTFDAGMSLNMLYAEDLDGDGLPELLASSFTPTGAQLKVFGSSRTGDNWDGYGSRALRTVSIPEQRFAVTASRLAAGPTRQLLAASTALSSLDPSEFASPNVPLGFEAAQMSTATLDTDRQQDLFIQAYPGVATADGKQVLGAVLYRDGSGFTPPRQVTVEFSPRQAVLALRRATVTIGQPWIQVLAAHGIGSDGRTRLYLLSDLCAQPSDLRILSAGAASQVIQARDGSVPLFSNKPAAIEINVDSRLEIAGVTVEGQVLDAAGTVLGTVSAANPSPTQRVRPGADGETLFQVVVPAALVRAGTYTARIHVRGPSAPADADASNSTIDVPLLVEQSRPVTFALVQWRYRVCEVADTDPGDPNACRPGAPLAPVSPIPTEEASRRLRALMPTGELQVLVTEIDDDGLAMPRHTQCDSCWLGRLDTARALFDAGAPGRASLPAYLLVDTGHSLTVALNVLTGYGNPASLTHEVGHMAGAPHVSCMGSPPPSDVPPGYPFADGRIGGPVDDSARYKGALIEERAGGGYAVTVQGPGMCDLMSYGSPRWPSGWTYAFLRAGVLRWSSMP